MYFLHYTYKCVHILYKKKELSRFNISPLEYQKEKNTAKPDLSQSPTSGQFLSFFFIILTKTIQSAAKVINFDLPSLIRVFSTWPHIQLKWDRDEQIGTQPLFFCLNIIIHSSLTFLTSVLTCLDCTWKPCEKRWQISYFYILGNFDTRDLLLKRRTARMKGVIKINEAFQRQHEKPAP